MAHIAATQLIAGVVVLALGAMACRPSRGTNSPADSGHPHVSTPALDAALTGHEELTLTVRQAIGKLLGRYAK